MVLRERKAVVVALLTHNNFKSRYLDLFLYHLGNSLFGKSDQPKVKNNNIRPDKRDFERTCGN